MKKAVDGLILRESAIGENDRLLTVLTAEGKMMMTAKGARSMRSKVASMCRLFTYANIEFYEKNDRRWLSGGSVNQSFFPLCEDLEDFSLASYIVQIADEITGEGVEAEDILRTTLNALYCIEKKKKPREQVKAAFELFAVRMSGISPELSHCARCGAAPEEKDDLWLDVMNGSLICNDCIKKASAGLPQPETDEYGARNILVPMDASAVACMRYVLDADIKRIFAFSLSGKSMEALSRAAEVYLLNHLERSFDTLEFYNKCKKL